MVYINTTGKHNEVWLDKPYAVVYSDCPSTEDAYNSGYTAGYAAGQEECSGYTQEDLDAAYASGYSAGLADCSGVTPTPDYMHMPLTFEILSGGTIGWDISRNDVKIECSTDSGHTWNVFSSLAVNAGDMVQFRGSGATGTLVVHEPVGASFTASGDVRFNACGNLYSLLDGENFANITDLSTYPERTFFGLFGDNTGIVKAENLKLPATTLQRECYRDLFRGCTNLTTPPDLLAPTLAWFSCAFMFSGCSSLNYVKCLATDLGNNNTTTGWLTQVSSQGTFVKATGVEWSIGAGGIPENWSVMEE